jgi:4,5-DOPA dioxygenase extradiol
LSFRIVYSKIEEKKTVQTMDSVMPLLFIGHGSPMNAIEVNAFTRMLQALGSRIPRPRLIVVISAHWVTGGTFVNGLEHPQQIYDFYGFPDDLYHVKYPAKGSPQDARRIIELGKNIPITEDDTWGIDHGSWTILRHIYPDAAIPVLQISLDRQKNGDQHREVAQALSSLRKEGVLIIGSGNIVHNLSLVSFDKDDNQSFSWAKGFDQRVKECLLKKDDAQLQEFLLRKDRESRLSLPTIEHYLPMLYIEALREENETIEFLYESVENKSISMRSFMVR